MNFLMNSREADYLISQGAVAMLGEPRTDRGITADIHMKIRTVLSEAASSQEMLTYRNFFFLSFV